MIGCYKMLSAVSCALQKIPVALFYIQQYIRVNPKLVIDHLLIPFGSHKFLLFVQF